MARILVVDDSKVITDLVKLMLQKSGYACMEANDANTCLQLLQNQKFDLILLDISMPDVDGLQLLETIKNDGKQGKVVLFTASSPTQDEMERYMAMGAADLLRKPVKKEFLITQVEKYLAQ